MEFGEMQKNLIQVALDYGKKCNIQTDEEYALHKLYEEIGEFSQAWLIHRHKCRPEKIVSEIESKKLLADELADIIGIAILNAHLLDIDIEDAIDNKWFKYLK